MSRKPIGWRMPQPLADSVGSNRRNQGTMVNLAGGVEKVASRITAPLKFPSIPETKLEGWRRRIKKGQNERPEGHYYRYVCRLPKGSKGAGRFVRRKRGRE